MTVIIKVPASRRIELEKITKDLEVKKPGLRARPKSIRFFFLTALSERYASIGPRAKAVVMMVGRLFNERQGR